METLKETRSDAGDVGICGSILNSFLGEGVTDSDKSNFCDISANKSGV